MPLYSYRAVSPAGDVSSGQLEAANESEIVDRLRDQGLLPMQIAQALGAAVIGAGGGARAIVCSLLDRGAREIRITNRTPARAGDRRSVPIHPVI